MWRQNVYAAIAIAATLGACHASEDVLDLSAGILTRTVRLTDDTVVTTDLAVGTTSILATPVREFSVTFCRADPNRKPPGQKKPGDAATDTVRWRDPVTVNGSRLHEQFDTITHRVFRPRFGLTRLDVQAAARSDGALHGVTIVLCYEAYDRDPAIRKWIEITNQSDQWLKIDNLSIEDLAIAKPYRCVTQLTPSERGAGSSVVAFGRADGSLGVIAVSEIPSALRHIRSDGAMGYAEEHFEWVLGPSESFRSEPVSYYAYAGSVEQLTSGVSTPLDRTVERPFKSFLGTHLKIDKGAVPPRAPLWSSWSNFGPNITATIVRRQADVAAQAGFRLVQLDQGWQRGLLGTEPDTVKFSDFEATCKHVTLQGLRLGLWVSCFRDPASKDLRDVPEGRSLPVVTRLNGIGMSFAGPWRDYYVKDLVALYRRYGVTYFKQDFTNIRFGDTAEGHESRTKKESLLRGLRGLLAAQTAIRREAPEVTLQISHEIYWGTPGVPCNVAALKHVDVFHIPPNDYSGVGWWGHRRQKGWKDDPEKLHAELIRGCFNARRRFYAHRGLPLENIEYYSAATFNAGGSLTPAVQDRQVASWLMGAPISFAGDLTSLTEKNVQHYRQRFDLITRLNERYGIYRHFQYSGVPAPTDEGWHWWGKLNEEGFGAVVVLRGSGGALQRGVTIPWAERGKTYAVRTLFQAQTMGRFTGGELRSGALRLSLPVYGQEMLELAPAP